MTAGNRLIVHTLVEKERKRKKAFTSARCEIIDDTLEVENEIETKMTENTYQMPYVLRNMSVTC